LAATCCRRFAEPARRPTPGLPTRRVSSRMYAGLTGIGWNSLRRASTVLALRLAVLGAGLFLLVPVLDAQESVNLLEREASPKSGVPCPSYSLERPDANGVPTVVAVGLFFQDHCTAQRCRTDTGGRRLRRGAMARPAAVGSGARDPVGRVPRAGRQALDASDRARESPRPAVVLRNALSRGRKRCHHLGAPALGQGLLSAGLS
jgi:hypothetical protein